MLKRLLSLAVSFLFFVSFCFVPARAESFGLGLDIVGLADWLIFDLMQNATIGGVNAWNAMFDDDVCANSPNWDGHHHFVEMNTQVDGERGLYYICEYCGKEAGEVLEEAESEYVASLPATTVNSDGGFIWYPGLDDISYVDVNGYGLGSPEHIYPGISKEGVSLTASSVEVHNRGQFYVYRFSLKVPVAGYYQCVKSLSLSGYYTSGQNQTMLNKDCSEFPSLNCIDITSPFLFQFGSFCTPWLSSSVYTHLNILYPAFLVTPLTPYNVASTDAADTYNVGTRASSITGNYGIVNSNGTITQVESQSIVNEGDSTVYNPVTNETYSMADWSYDYSDRSYHVTTEQGDTLTVTYGDENVTIQEGDTVYNVYYITNTSSSDNEGGNSGSGESPPPTHTHNYTSDITTAPTCTLPGVRTFTCSCGASYTQQIAPAGHTWEVKNHVNMEYDTDGELLQQGYTVYRCSVCGEEYRSPDDSLPPGLMETDNQLAEVSNKVQAWYNSLRELYQGYIGFLTDAFRFLPDELVTLIEFGIGSSFVIALSKKLLR